MVTEEKIKEAAKQIFKLKGYAGTKTRDIAEEAGVNPALLNYYFRSKDGLFKEVMKDTIRDFISAVRPTLSDRNKNFKEVLVDLFNRLTDLYLDEPDLVIFIINELRTMPQKLIDELHLEEVFRDTIMFDFFEKNFAERNERSSIERCVMFVISCVSFILFPFVMKPAVANFMDVSDEEFRAMVNERRQMYPAWSDFIFEQFRIKL